MYPGGASVRERKDRAWLGAAWLVTLLAFLAAYASPGRAGAGPAILPPAGAPAIPAGEMPPLFAMERSTLPGPVLTRAIELLEAGRWQEAQSALQPLLKPGSTDPQEDRAHALMLAGLAAGMSGDAMRAAALLDEALSLNKASVVIRLNLARLHLQAGKAAQAARALEDARSVAPADPRVLGWLGVAWYNVGLAYQRSQNPSSAREAYRRALEAEGPHRAAAHNNLGVLAFNEGRVDEAERHFREAVRADPGEALYHANLGAALRASGKLEQAVLELKQAVAQGPASASLLLEYGFALLAARKFDEAASVFQQAVERLPMSADALFGLATAIMGQGRLQQARLYLERALQASPTYWRAHYALGAAYQAAGDREEARKAYEQAIRHAPAVPELRAALGELYLELGRHQDAEQQLQAALALGDGRPAIWYAIGRAQLMGGRSAEAAASFGRAAELAQGDPPAQALYLYAQALAVEAGGEVGAAVQLLRQALEADAGLFEAHLRLGELLLARGHAAAAIAPLERAAELRPWDTRARQALDHAKAAAAGR